MSIQDSKSLMRSVQRLVVEAKIAHGSPPVYERNWQTVWGAKVDRIDIHEGNTPSIATIWFPSIRWNGATGLNYGDYIRIRTDEFQVSQRTILFAGFLVKFLREFSGGSDEPGSAYERNAFVVLDHRWLLSLTSPVFGQLMRSPACYENYGDTNQYPIDGAFFWATGRRCIFNEKQKPNRDPEMLKVYDPNGEFLCYNYIFIDSSKAVYWTARDMLIYILSPLFNQSYNYFPLADPSQLTGLSSPDFNCILGDICIDGLNTMEACELMCKHLGWSFRLDFNNNDSLNLVFYKPGSASDYSRSYPAAPIILQRLYAPAVGENVADGVHAGRKILWSMELSSDIINVVNNPWGIGTPDRFEFTAELVPAWSDESLIPDTSDDYANLFFTEAELNKEEAPDTYSFFNYYHSRGSSFLRDVGRKWALNESGSYTFSCNRGLSFDFATVIPPQYIFNMNGEAQFAPVRRRLLPALTLDLSAQNSIGIKVEISLDGGATWQTVDASISNLADECGIHIDEANLAEIIDKNKGTISGGVLEGKPLNLWTSLADDKLNNRSFINGQWHTRVRVTASVQMDRRTFRQSPADIRLSGSPFHQSQLFDFSEKYGVAKRTTASSFYNTDFPAWDIDDTEWLDQHLGGIRRANQDLSISGQFTLERLWLGDGRGQPDFALGDCIERIDGRNFSLCTSYSGGGTYPEIVKIIYLPDKQKMQLLTRDLRYSPEVVR